jgi:membrane associated rhomboid family serine protease
MKKQKEKKPKNYKLRSKVYKGIGTSLTFLTTLAGFVVYESLIDWENFKNDLEHFIVVNPDTVKVNLAIAFPLLIAILVFVWVFWKKNKEQLKGKVMLPILFTTIILWLIYSVIEATLCALIGAFVGAFFDEVVFMPLSNKAKEKAEDDHEIAQEIRKEKVRKKVRDELDGSV